MSPVKEPHHFNADGLRGIAGRQEYESLFLQADDRHCAVGEASTNYLYSRVAVPAILKYDSGAKFVVCLRNPVQACQALHLERLYQGMEDVRDFEQAWNLQEARARGEYIPFNLRADPERLQYGKYCLFGAQMQRLYGVVPKNQVQVVLLDDIRDNPSQAYASVLHFLGAPEGFEPDFEIHNKAKRTRSIRLAVLIRAVGQLKKRYLKDVRLGMLQRVKSWNTGQPTNARRRDDTARMLRAYFKEDVVLLSSLIKRDLSGWLT